MLCPWQNKVDGRALAWYPLSSYPTHCKISTNLVPQKIASSKPRYDDPRDIVLSLSSLPFSSPSLSARRPQRPDRWSLSLLALLSPLSCHSLPGCSADLIKKKKKKRPNLLDSHSFALSNFPAPFLPKDYVAIITYQ